MRDIDQIGRMLVECYPETRITQLGGLHDGDDNGLWLISHPASRHEAQLESTTGQCPFLLESDRDDQRITVATVSQAIVDVVAKLGLPTIS